jgi:hypothetical protein
MSHIETAPAPVTLGPDEFRVRSCTVKPLTMQLAAEFSLMEGSWSERKLNEKHVAALKDRVLKGWAVPFNWVTMKLPPDELHPEGHVLRINGFHSSTALARMNGAFPEGLLISHTELEGGGIGAAPLAFRQFDAMVSARTRQEISNAYLQIEPELRGLDPQMARVGLEGISWFRHKVRGEQVERGDDLYKDFADPAYHPYLKMLQGVIGEPKTQPALKRSAVWGAFYGMFLLDEHDAKEFLTKVIHTLPEERDNGPSEPAKALSAWLHEVIVDHSKLNSDHSAIEPHQIYNACVIGWRAFRDNRVMARAIKTPSKTPESYTPLS